jgi:probable phosphoglycerate mutase
MNHLLEYSRLNNRFFVMRHGESDANRQGLIISSPANGIDSYGLSERGRRQVAASVAASVLLTPGTLIYSSDFKRALETAQIVHDILGCNTAIQIREALRERFFGDWEKTRHDNYHWVWQLDEQDAAHTGHRVEAALAGMARGPTLILELDREQPDQLILLVAPGDVLQILQTAFHKEKAERHRSLPHLHTAEIRELKLAD